MKDIKLASLEELQAFAKQIQDEVERRKPKRGTFYLHSDKDYSYEVGDKLKLTEDQIQNFRYTGSEVAIEFEVDEDGHAWATHFNGVPLPQRITF